MPRRSRPGGCCGSTPPRLAQTIALTATSVGGLVAAADTSVAREYHAGLVVRSGIDAALAAARGFIAEERILEVREGLFPDLWRARTAQGVTDGLGKEWDIVTDMAVKLVPGGHPYHAFGEAAANAARDGNIKRRRDRQHHRVAPRPDPRCPARCTRKT